MLIFDTLEYAKMLASNGIGHGDIYASALSRALSQNLYTKHEVDNVHEASLRRFDASYQASLQAWSQRFDAHAEKNWAILRAMDERILAMDERILSLENRMERLFNRYLYTTVGILGSLIVFVSTVGAFVHAFSH